MALHSASVIRNLGVRISLAASASRYRQTACGTSSILRGRLRNERAGRGTACTELDGTGRQYASAMDCPGGIARQVLGKRERGSFDQSTECSSRNDRGADQHGHIVVERDHDNLDQWQMR